MRCHRFVSVVATAINFLNQVTLVAGHGAFENYISSVSKCFCPRLNSFETGGPQWKPSWFDQDSVKMRKATLMPAKRYLTICMFECPAATSERLVGACRSRSNESDRRLNGGEWKWRSSVDRELMRDPLLKEGRPDVLVVQPRNKQESPHIQEIPGWWANPLRQHPKLVKPLWQMHQRNSARCLCAHSFCNACCTAFCASIVSQQLDMLVIWVATYLSSENVSPVLLSSACFWKHLHQSTQAWFGSIKKLCRVDFLFGLTIRLTKHYRSNGHFFSRLQPKHRPNCWFLVWQVSHRKDPISTVIISQADCERDLPLCSYL